MKRVRDLPVEIPRDIYRFIGSFLLLPYPVIYENMDEENDALQMAGRYSQTCKFLSQSMDLLLKNWKAIICCRVCRLKRGMIHCNCSKEEDCRFRTIKGITSGPNTLCLECSPDYCDACESGSCGCVPLTRCEQCDRPPCVRTVSKVIFSSFTTFCPVRINAQLCTHCG
jgi:hypothetical protein